MNIMLQTSFLTYSLVNQNFRKGVCGTCPLRPAAFRTYLTTGLAFSIVLNLKIDGPVKSQNRLRRNYEHMLQMGLG